MNKTWIYVVLTCVFELIWLYGFNVASKGWHWLLIIFFIILDLQCLAKACERLPTGTVYAVFAAIGTLGTLFMDIVLFDHEITLLMVTFIGFILLGVLGLNLFDTNPKEELREKQGSQS